MNQLDLKWLESVARDLRANGYSVQDGGVPESLLQALHELRQQLDTAEFQAACIGRKRDNQTDPSVRRDRLCWIEGNSAAGALWLDWTGQLQRELNRTLLLGLFSFESHFAHYGPGDFYKTHFDAFKGQANRCLSAVLYLNPEWSDDWGGQLRLYLDESLNDSIDVTPKWGRLVLFLSEDFPHEVMPAARDRYSIAGWFRVNSSHSQRVDPPK